MAETRWMSSNWNLKWHEDCGPFLYGKWYVVAILDTEQ